MSVSAEDTLRDQSRTRWLELGGALGEAKASIELIHDRGLLSDDLFWEAIGAVDAMFELVDDITYALEGTT
jgi:hypothetical protein